MTQDEAVAIAQKYAVTHQLPVGNIVDSQHNPVGECRRLGLNTQHGDWLVAFHYIGPLNPSHPKVTLRMDVGWLLCVIVNDVTGEAELWLDYRDEQRATPPPGPKGPG